MTDRAAAELAEAEQQVRALARCRSNGGALEIVLAELDRQRGLIAAVLAECSEAEAVAGWNTARVTVTKIRTLLEGEGR